MANLQLNNNAIALLAASILSTDTTISLVPGSGAKFPALAPGQWFPATIIKMSGQNEIVKVTGRTLDVLTVVRGQETTTALAFGAGDKIELRLTAGAFTGEIARLDAALALTDNTLRADLADDEGSDAVTFLQAGTGAVPLTLQEMLRTAVHIKQFGAVGDGVTDNRLAIQRACDASLVVYFGETLENYRVAGAVTLRSGQVLYGNGAAIIQATNNTEIFNVEGKSNITVSHLNLTGTGEYTNSDSSRSVAVYGGTSGKNIHVTRCNFKDFGYTPVRFHGQSNCSFTFNTVEGPGAPTLQLGDLGGRNYGVLVDAGCVNTLVEGNDISKTGQGVMVNGGSNCRIIANYLHDITGQHGIYSGGGLRNLVIANNVIEDTGIIGIKCQAAEYALEDNINISITGNTLYNIGDNGIVISNGLPTAGALYKCRNVTITGNSVQLTGGSGLSINNTIGAVVAGNSFDQCGFSGIAWSESSNLKISHNQITRCALSGMRDGAYPCDNVTVSDNKVINCATANSGTDEFGLFVQSGTNYSISGNEFADANANMRYGVYLAGGTMGTFSVNRNHVLNATDAGLRLASTAAMRSYKDNIWNGTLAATFNDPVLPAVGSAATLTLPTGHAVISVTGAATVTYITPNGHSGRQVTLILEAGVTITDGSNILIASTLVATANDSLTLACDGLNWIEISRSIN